MDDDIGQRCIANGSTGTIRFIGTTQFSQGIWIGVELDAAEGKNDGSIQDVRYFSCESAHGVFVRRPKVALIDKTTYGDTNDSSTPHLASHKVSKLSNRAGRQSLAQTLPLPPTGYAASPQYTVKVETPRQINPPTPLGAKKSLLVSSKVSSTSKNTSRDSSNSQLQLRTNRPDQASISRSASRSSSSHLEKADSKDSLALSKALLSTQLDASATVIESRAETAEDALHNSDGVITPIKDLGSGRKIDLLQSRLKTLEAQRIEDAKRLSALGALESEKQAWTTIRSKLRDKLQGQQIEIADLKEKVKALESAIEHRQASGLPQEFQEHGDTADLLEMATLDREMAEEERDQIRTELEHVKTRNEELILELEIIKEEGTAGRSNTAGDGSNLNTRALETQNDKLKEALIRLKEITAEQDRAIQEATKESELQVLTIQELEAQLESSKSQLSATEILVSDLRSQVDLSIGAEEMLESLSERNLSLGEQLELCRAEIADLEALKLLNDEIEEAHQNARQEYSQEMKLRDAIVEKQTARLIENQQSISEYEETLSRYRALASQLQAEISEAKADGSRGEAITIETANKLRRLEVDNQELKAREHRFVLSHNEIELRRLDFQIASHHLDIMRNYIPSSYESDKGAVEAYLKAQRIEGLGSFLMSRWNKRIQTDDDQWFLHHIGTHEIVRQLSNASRLLCCYIRFGPVSAFYKLPQISVAPNNNFDAILEQLTAALDTTPEQEINEGSLPGLVINFMDMLKDMDMVVETFPLVKLQYETSLQNLELSDLLWSKIGYLVQRIASSSVPQETLITLRSSTNTCRNILTRITALADQACRPATQIVSAAATLEAQTSTLCSYLIHHYETLLTEHEQVESVLEAVMKCSHECLEKLKHIQQSQESVLDSLSSGEAYKEGDVLLPPWTIQGIQAQQARSSEVDPNQKTEALHLEMKQLVSHLHNVQRSYEEERVKTEALERRLQAQSDSLTELRNLKENETRLEADRQAYEEAVEELGNQVTDLQGRLRDQRPSTSRGALSLITTSTDSQMKEVDLLQKTIKHLTLQLAEAKRDTTLPEYAFLQVPMCSAPPVYTREKEAGMYRELRNFVQAVELIDFKHTPPLKKQWTRMQDKCGHLHFHQEEEYAHLLAMKKRLA